MDQTHHTVLWSLRQFRTRFRDVVACSIGFNLLNLFVLAPVVSGLIRLMLGRWGRASVGNFEIAAFLLSLPGVTALVAGGGLSIAIHFLEYSALVRLLSDRERHWWSALGGAAGVFHRLVELGVREVTGFAILAIPFLTGIGIVYFSMWAGRDLNGLIILRPPVFWIGAGLAATIALGYALLAARLFVRWLFAVPILLFDGVRPKDALVASDRLTRGRKWRLAVTLGLWFAVISILGITLAYLVKQIAERILEQSGHSLSVVLPVTAAILVINTAMLTIGAAATSSSFAALVLSLYWQATGQVPAERHEADLPERRDRVPTRWLIVGGLGWIAVSMTVISGWLVSDVALRDRVEITAHRAGALRAPENTVAAIRQAIVDGADWAEIDVQRTADDELVVMHDVDLARIGGGNRRVDQATLSEIQLLDVGAAFGPQFAGEKVPTLEDVLRAAGDQLRLNVELKPHSRQDAAPLAERTLAAIREAGLVDRCRVCSQSYEAIQAVRGLEPGIEIGFIAAVAVGDLAKLDVDFLMVSLDRAERALADRAGLRGVAIHAWTVNEPGVVPRLVDDGVSNIITDDPPGIRAALAELEGLNPVERLLMRARRELMR